MAVSLREIQSDPEFQALPFDNRKKILNGWYKDTVTIDPEYQSLPTIEQTRIHQNFEKEASVTPGASGTWGDPSTFEVVKKSLQHAPYSAAQGVGGLGRMLGEAVGSEKIADWGRDVYQGADIEMQKDMPEIRGGVKRAVYGGVQSLAQNIPGLAASVVTGSPVPALASIGALAGGQSYGESREKGVTPGKAALGAVGEGGLEVATEYIPMGYLLKPGLSFARRTLFTTLSEIVGENINTVGQKAVKWWTQNPDKTVGEFVGELYPDAKQTSLQVLMTSPVMALGAQVAHRAMPQPQVERPFIEPQEESRRVIDPFQKTPQIQQAEKQEVVLPEGDVPFTDQPSMRRLPNRMGQFTPVQPQIPQGIRRPEIEEIPLLEAEQFSHVKPPEILYRGEVAPEQPDVPQAQIQSSAITVGTKFRTGKSPQTWTVTKAHESTPGELELGEQYFDATNDKTGEVAENIQLKDIKPLKGTQPIVKTIPSAVGMQSDVIQDELLQAAQSQNIFQQLKKITSLIKIDKGFFDHFDRTELRPIVQKSPGLFSTKKGMPLDEVADGLGISTDELANKLRDVVSKKAETENLKKQIEEYTPPTDMVSVGDLQLNPGDKFKIHGEPYQVTQRNEDGHLVIKDGITYEVDEFDKIPKPDEGSLKKGKPKFVQPKMFEGEKVDIKPTLDTEVAGQGKLFGTPQGETVKESVELYKIERTNDPTEHVSERERIDYGAYLKLRKPFFYEIVEHIPGGKEKKHLVRANPITIKGWEDYPLYITHNPIYNVYNITHTPRGSRWGTGDTEAEAVQDFLKYRQRSIPHEEIQTGQRENLSQRPLEKTERQEISDTERTDIVSESTSPYDKLNKLKQSLSNNQYDPSIPLSHYRELGKPRFINIESKTTTQEAFTKLRRLMIDNPKGYDILGGKPVKTDAEYLNRNPLQQKPGNVKAGQLTPEQFKEMTSDVNIGREGKASIKSDVELRYAPGTGINLETLDLPPDIKHTIYKLTQQYQPIFEEQRNRQTWEEINKEAESSGFDAEQLLERQKGEAYNAAKLKAVKDIQNNTTFEAKRVVDTAVKLLNDPLLTEDQQAEILATANLKMKKAAAILAQAGGAYSEAGRALNILKQVTGARKAEKNWKAILDALGGREMTLDIFRKISGVDISSVPETAKFIRTVQKARTPDMVLEAWRNAILSGTKTLITNPLSNAITFFSNPIETGIAATIEKGRSLITGNRPQVYFREVNAEIVGAIDGIWNGMRVFLNTLETEVPEFGGELKIEQAINQVSIPGKTGRVIRYPQRLLTAQDDLAKSVIYDSTMKALAVRLAIRKGLKGEKLTDFVATLLTNPQGRNKKIYDVLDKRARNEADYRTYNKALGKIGQMVMKLRDVEFPAGSGIKPIYYILPFIRTPTNIVKYGLERTPLNFARVGYKTVRGEIPNSQISEEFAKPIVGTLMFLLTWLLYGYGYITGGAPREDNDRKTWYAAGKKEYSFYAPWIDRYISYQRIEPLGSILGMGADFFENIHRGVKNPKDAATKIMTSISKNWTNKTFVLGLTNAMNAYTDPERYGDRFVDGLTSSLVPNIISSFNPDQYHREKDSFLDSMKAKIPGLSETLPPKRDITGAPARRGEGRGSALMNQILPFGITKPTSDPVSKELLRLNDAIDFSVGASPKYFRINKQKINISPDVYSEYIKESGELAHKMIVKAMERDRYQKADDENKAEIVRSLFDRARNYVRPKYIRKLRNAG